MNILKQLIQDGAGNTSSIRAAFLLVIAGVVFNWCYLTIKTGTAQQLDWNQVTLVLGAFAAKVGQRAFEPTDATPPAVNPPKTP